MRKLLVVAGALAAMMFVGCVPSPAELCKTNVATTCDKVFECNNPPSDAVKLFFGADATECKTKLETAADCAGKTTQDQLCTGDNAGKKFNLSNAAACDDKTKTMACTDFLGKNMPAECAKICE